MTFCPFTKNKCSTECNLFQERKDNKYSGCAINLIANHAVSQTIKEDVDHKIRTNIPSIR